MKGELRDRTGKVLITLVVGSSFFTLQNRLLYGPNTQHKFGLGPYYGPGKFDDPM